MRRVLAVLPSLLGACAAGAPSANHVPAGLAPFAEACRFLPAGFDSIALSTEQLAHAPTAPARARSFRCARVGSDFQAPKGVGIGAYRGVGVADLGDGGLQHDPEPPRKPPTDVLDGVPVWRYAEDELGGHHAERWEARVDDRFVVWASDRELLRRALARTGGVEELLRPFAAVRAVPGDAEALVCTLPRAAVPGWDRAVPREPLVVSVRRGRLQVLHHQPLPELYEGWAEIDGARPTTARAGDWLRTEFTIQGDASFLVDMLFGLAIFL